ncbi:hypothetical protein [Aurantibacillus circumpalustris]|uniref:hypothetical protein n=1 Tax=Aurantibacillus circumpalustris TaxID=3036359 RepID=UPI00295A95E6|nr:hypothetical protein [Aurantibacillus circumpalustris]
MSTEINTTSLSFVGTQEEQGVKLIFTPSKRKKTKKINIGIEGIFNLSSANYVRESILPAIYEFETIDISLKNIQQIDLSALQLLHYMQQLTIENQKQISFDAELSTEDRSLLFNAGLKQLITKATLTDK